MRDKQTGTDPILTETFTRLSGTDRDNVQLAEDMRGPQAAAFTVANCDELNRTRVWFAMRETVKWGGKILTAGNVYSCLRTEWKDIEVVHPGSTLRTSPPIELEVSEG